MGMVLPYKCPQALQPRRPRTERGLPIAAVTLAAAGCIGPAHAGMVSRRSSMPKAKWYGPRAARGWPLVVTAPLTAQSASPAQPGMVLTRCHKAPGTRPYAPRPRE